jgi:hypothetical protein
MRRCDGNGWKRVFRTIVRSLALVGLLHAATGVALAADPTMFEGDRARQALEAIATKAGHKLRFLDLEITAEALIATVDPANPDRVVPWRVAPPRGWMSALIGDLAVSGPSTEPTLARDTLAESVFDLDPAALAHLPDLAAAALKRARLRSPARSFVWSCVGPFTC